MAGCLFVQTAGGCAQIEHFPSNEDLRHLRVISSPQISPDGKHVVALVQDSTADGGITHLWLLSVSEQAPRQITFSSGEGAGERQAAYLPDGSAILFLARREDKSRLMRLPLQGGEASPIKIERPPSLGETAAAVDVSSYVIAPDGKTIAVTASDPEAGSRTKDKRDKKDAIWTEHDELKRRLYLLNSATLEVREVPKIVDPDSVAWSTDATQLLVLTHAHLRDLGPSAVGMIVSAAKPEVQQAVAHLPESTRRAAWSHDGRSLILFAKCEKDAPEGCADLFTLELGSGKLHNLTAALSDSTLAPTTLIVADDDRTALVSVNHGMRESLARVDLQSGKVQPFALGMPVVSTPWQEPHSKALVYVGSASTLPPAVYLTTDAEKPGTRLAQPELVPPGWKFIASKPVHVKRDHYDIEGLLYLPPQATACKVPLVVNVHGGPTGQFNDAYSPLTNLLVGQGWAVLITNPRGSTGYGVAFEAANKDDMGNGDYLDIMAVVDEVIHTEPIDPERLALIGYSYGGEMAGFVEGKTTRFKAIVSGAPVIDQFSEYGTESESFGDRWFTGQPWRHFESAWRQSPLAYAQHAKTPFLLLQGQTDTTDPEGQSREMYRALRQEGVPVQMLLFPREDHGALGGNFAGRPSTEPWHGVIAREHMLKFIADGFAGTIEPNQP